MVGFYKCFIHVAVKSWSYRQYILRYFFHYYFDKHHGDIYDLILMKTSYISEKNKNKK